jgi:hypothetical protein
MQIQCHPPGDHEESANDFALILFVHERKSSYIEAHGLARSSAYREYGHHVWLLDSSDDFCIPKYIMI